MIKRIGKYKVDVSHKNCSAELECFQLGFDKGSYTPGIGYTSYYDKERPVCWTRHMHGCPSASICPKCRSIHSPAATLEGKCRHCKGPLEEYKS